MQKIILDINPKGEIPVLHVAQYDKGRSFEVELVDGEQAYNVPSGYSVQLNVRKTDSKLVTAAPTSVADNILTFATSEQMTACAGENIASVTLKDADDIVITSLYFLISVQRDVLAGGLSSASEIHNLEEQIASIVPEVIGNDYYNKTETDALLANKANLSDLATLASKADLENAIEEEDRTLKDWAFTQFATYPGIAQRYYNKNQVDDLIDNIFPTLSASGAIASFVTALNKYLVSVTHDAGATTITRCGVNLWDEDMELGSISWGSGEPYVDNTRMRFADFVRVSEGISIYIVCPSAYDIHIYDINKAHLTAVYKSAGGAYTIPSGGAYIKLATQPAYGTTYNNDISINCPAADTSYHAYEGQTVPVADALTLTTLSGVNNVFADVGEVTVQYKYMSI